MSLATKLKIITLKVKDRRNIESVRELGAGESGVWRASLPVR